MLQYLATTIKGDNTEIGATFLLRNKGSCHADVTIQRRTGNY